MPIFNIEEHATGRQANHVLESSLSDAVRPWFSDVSDNATVARALSLLGSERASERSWAQRVLGVSIVAA